MLPTQQSVGVIGCSKLINYNDTFCALMVSLFKVEAYLGALLNLYPLKW